MKANELRIGNYVRLFEKGFYKVHTISRKVIQVHGDLIGGEVFDFFNIQPIPLTPEILEKCGFEYVTDWTVPDKRKHDCVTFLDLGYMYLASGMMGGGVTLFQNDRRSTGTNIEYLHQLQNLYFCLCGEELEVKL